MCLGLPGRIVSINGKVAIVDFWGMRNKVRLEILEEPVSAGDYILDHAGYAIRRIAPEDVTDTIALYEQVLAEACCDPISLDVVAELESTQEIAVEMEYLV